MRTRKGIPSYEQIRRAGPRSFCVTLRGLGPFLGLNRTYGHIRLTLSYRYLSTQTGRMKVKAPVYANCSQERVLVLPRAVATNCCVSTSVGTVVRSPYLSIGRLQTAPIIGPTGLLGTT